MDASHGHGPRAVGAPHHGTARTHRTHKPVSNERGYPGVSASAGVSVTRLRGVGRPLELFLAREVLVVRLRRETAEPHQGRTRRDQIESIAREHREAKNERSST